MTEGRNALGALRGLEQLDWISVRVAVARRIPQQCGCTDDPATLRMGESARTQSPDLSLQIRLATADDAAPIARLTTELGYPTTTEQASSRLTFLLPRDSYFVAVADVSSQIVGWVAAERRLLLESGERVEIVGLIVSAAARRNGIGAALVEAAEDWARAQGMQVLSVRSNVARVEAHPFYERLGYVRSKTQHAYTKQLAP